VTTQRTFGALLSHDTVCLVEYVAEQSGVRIVKQWVDRERTELITDAVARLSTLLSALGLEKPRVAIAIEQFGVFHHVLTRPNAPDDVLRPIVARESHELFGVEDPVVVFARGPVRERREGGRADSRTAPTQFFVAGAPRHTIDTIHRMLADDGVDVEIVTVVPKSVHGLYRATGATLEPTAVLVCLESGPHLGFFLGGRLELALDPPVSVGGERAPVQVILDQLERGGANLRQRFGGVAATQLFLSAPAGEFDAIVAAHDDRLHVSALFAGAAPEAVVAMGAVLEALQSEPLDLHPRAPAVVDRARSVVRGPNAGLIGVAAAALAAGIWATTQLVSLSSARREADDLRAALAAGAPALQPLRRTAELRADFAGSLDFVAATQDERSMLTNSLKAIAESVPADVQFDSLNVARAATGWTVTIAGESTGGSAARAVNTLDALYQSVRGSSGVTAASLDNFDYPAAARRDSTRAGSPVVIRFKMTLTLAAPEHSESRTGQ
jgi:Tfp pilus assembly protein PilN